MSYQEVPVTGADLVTYSDGVFTNNTDFSKILPALTPPLSQSDIVRLYASKYTSSLLHRLAQAPGEVLDILPGRPARARAPGDCPFERLVFDFFARAGKTEVLGVAEDHREIIVLRTGMKAEPKPKTVR